MTYVLLKVHPIAAVEIEVSPWSYESETQKGMCEIRVRDTLIQPCYSHRNGEGTQYCCGRLFVSLNFNSAVTTVPKEQSCRPLGRGIFAGSISKSEDLSGTGNYT